MELEILLDFFQIFLNIKNITYTYTHNIHACSWG